MYVIVTISIYVYSYNIYYQIWFNDYIACGRGTELFPRIVLIIHIVISFQLINFVCSF